MPRRPAHEPRRVDERRLREPRPCAQWLRRPPILIIYATIRCFIELFPSVATLMVFVPSSPGSGGNRGQGDSPTPGPGRKPAWTKTAFCIPFQIRWTKTAFCMSKTTPPCRKVGSDDASTRRFVKASDSTRIKRVCRKPFLASVSKKVCRKPFLATPPAPSHPPPSRPSQSRPPAPRRPRPVASASSPHPPARARGAPRVSPRAPSVLTLSRVRLARLVLASPASLLAR